MVKERQPRSFRPQDEAEDTKYEEVFENGRRVLIRPKTKYEKRRTNISGRK